MSLVYERLLGRSGLGWIDPDGRGTRRRLRYAPGKPFGMRGMRRRQDLGAADDASLGQAVVDIVRREQAEAGVTVLGVVPGEEDVAMRSGILDRAEPVREVGPVLERFELRLREGIVVRDVRAGVGLRHAEIGQQERDGLRGHRRTTVGVNRELIAPDRLP